MRKTAKLTKGIFLALPCGDGKVELETMESIISLYLKCKEKRIPLGHKGMAGCSLIPKGRTDLANMFMYDTNMTHFLFIDSDIKFNADDIIKMYESKKDIIAGTYVKKYLNWHQLINNAVKEGTWNSDDLLINSGEYALANLEGKKGAKIMKADYVSTGMLMINRNVFTQISLLMDNEFYMNKGNKFYTYFETSLKPIDQNRNLYLSEDYAFCERARSAGFDINILMDCDTTHFGRFAFKGNLKQYIDNGNR